MLTLTLTLIRKTAGFRRRSEDKGENWDLLTFPAQSGNRSHILSIKPKLRRVICPTLFSTKSSGRILLTTIRMGFSM